MNKENDKADNEEARIISFEAARKKQRVEKFSRAGAEKNPLKKPKGSNPFTFRFALILQVIALVFVFYVIMRSCRGG